MSISCERILSQLENKDLEIKILQWFYQIGGVGIMHLFRDFRAQGVKVTLPELKEALDDLEQIGLIRKTRLGRYSLTTVGEFFEVCVPPYPEGWPR